MLFRKIRRRTRLRIMAPILISLFLACLTIMIVVSQSYFRSYNVSAQQSVQQKEKAADLSLRLIEETSMQYSFDKDNPVYALNLLVQKDKGILSAAYLVDGQLFVSAKASGYPDYGAFTALPAVKGFLENGGENLWFLRNTAIAEFYSNKKYDPQRGVLTYLRKEADGVLVIDVDTSVVFSIVDGDGEPKNGILLQSDGLILFSDPSRVLTGSERSAIQKLLSGSAGSVTVAGKNAKVFSIAVTDGITLTTEISYRYVIRQILTLALPIGALLVLFIGLTLLASMLLTGTIIHPLESLYNKMRQEKLADINKEE